jgi:hypothetical protein
MAKGVNPFAGKKAPPFGKGGGGKGGFEGSKRDFDPPGVKEGSPRDMAMDKKQRAMPPQPPMAPAFKRGGSVKRK